MKRKDKYKNAYDLKCIEILSYKMILANIMNSFNVSFDQIFVALKLSDKMIDLCKKKYECNKNG